MLNIRNLTDGGHPAKSPLAAVAGRIITWFVPSNATRRIPVTEVAVSVVGCVLCSDFEDTEYPIAFYFDELYWFVLQGQWVYDLLAESDCDGEETAFASVPARFYLHINHHGEVIDYGTAGSERATCGQIDAVNWRSLGVKRLRSFEAVPKTAATPWHDLLSNGNITSLPRPA